MQQIICPLDNLPCEQECPDRYQDQLEGGCFLTTALELGFNVIAIHNAPAGGDMQ